MPAFSTFEIDREEEMTYEFLFRHINGLYHSRDMKWARFREDIIADAMMSNLDARFNRFMEITKDLSILLHQVIHDNSATMPSLAIWHLFCLKCRR